MRLDHLLSKEYPLEESGKSGQQTRKCLKVVKKRRRYCLILRFLGTGISKDESGSLKPKRLLREELETKGNERKRVRIWKEGKNPAAAKNGGVAQLGEHLPCTQGVRSSILLISTKGLRLERGNAADLKTWAHSSGG